MFDRVTVPPAVRRELGSDALEPWLRVQPLTLPVATRVLDARVHAGETEAIALALEMQAWRVVLDDRQARDLAQELGLWVIGTVGEVVSAKRLSIIDTVGPILHALVGTGFHMSHALFAGALVQSGEVE